MMQICDRFKDIKGAATHQIAFGTFTFGHLYHAGMNLWLVHGKSSYLYKSKRTYVCTFFANKTIEHSCSWDLIKKTQKLLNFLILFITIHNDFIFLFIF